MVEEINNTWYAHGTDTNLQEFMNQDACSIHHRKVEWTPVGKEREVGELVVNRKIVVHGLIVGG